MLDVAMGQSVGVEIPAMPPRSTAMDDESRRQRDADWMVRAFDMNAADRDAILEHKFTFRKALPDTISTLSQAFATSSFSELVANRSTICAARDDVRNALAIGANLFEALEDIYGSDAFGLRLAAWIAEKKPELTIAMMLLGMARLRQIPNDLYSSAEIAKMAEDAKKCRASAIAIGELRKYTPAFKEVLSPKRIKTAFADQPSLNNWRREIAVAREAARTID
jgi:hypothetical protein